MDREDEYSRVEAIRALAGDSSPETEAFLLDSISDANQEVRKAALDVLGQMFNSDYDPVFLAALDDEDEGVRKMAAEGFASPDHSDFAFIGSSAKLMLLCRWLINLFSVYCSRINTNYGQWVAVCVLSGLTLVYLCKVAQTRKVGSNSQGILLYGNLDRKY